MLGPVGRDPRSQGPTATAAPPHVHEPGPRPGEYERWIAEYDTLSADDRRAIAVAIDRLERRPLVSVMLIGSTPGDNGEADRARSAGSLLDQLYPDWELLIPGETASGTPVDARMRRLGPIPLAATASQARGELLAFLEAGDILPPHALFTMVVERRAAPETDLFYSDEDEIDPAGRRSRPYFKSGWNADLFLGQDYACRLAVVSPRVAEGLAHGAADAAGVYDLILRIPGEKPAAVVRHVPFLLYRRKAGRKRSDLEAEAMRRAVDEHLQGRPQPAGVAKPSVVPLPEAHRRVVWPLPEPPPKVSLVIPTRDRVELLRTSVEGIRRDTEYPDIEIVIVDNDSRDAETLDYLRSLGSDPRIRVLSYPGEFNYAAINNFGVAEALGEIVGLLNNDLRIFEPGWLREMVSQAVRPEVGAVGAMLYYADDTVQHAGAVLGIGGVASHVFKRHPSESTGYHWRMALTQELSAVTAACLLTRRDVWEKVGGLDESFRVAYNDIDLCLRIRGAGYRVIWTPFARLYHLESASRGREDDPEKQARFNAEKARMVERWGELLVNDPFFNPNLSLKSVDCRPAFPPRVGRAWRNGQVG
jgi:GT2 family glycosyltransferase